MLAQGTIRRAIVAASVVLVGIPISLATPPAANDLGTTFKVVARGQTNLIEVRLKPKVAFDTVRVEAASGAALLAPPCAFSGVVVGGAYVCTVSVSHKAGDASLTLNVVGERRADPAKPPIVEVSHFTLPNAAHVAPAARRADRPTPGLISTPQEPAAK